MAPPRNPPPPNPPWKPPPPPWKPPPPNPPRADASGAVASPTAATVTAANNAKPVFRNMTVLRKGYRTRTIRLAARKFVQVSAQLDGNRREFFSEISFIFGRR